MKQIVLLLSEMVADLSRLTERIVDHEATMLKYVKRLEERIKALENANKN